MRIRPAVPALALFLATLAAAQDSSELQKLREEMLREMQALRAEVQGLREQNQELQRRVLGAEGSRSPGAPATSVPSSFEHPAAPPAPSFAATSSAPFHIGGQYRMMGSYANFDWHQAAIGDEETRHFYNQRLRLWSDVTPTERVRGHVQVEIGHIVWGQNLEFTKTYAGPKFSGGVDPDDRVGIELRRGYLEYTHEDLGQFRIGIQDWQDLYGQTLASSDWDFNVGGLSWTKEFPDACDLRLRAGAFALWEGEAASADDAALYALDATFRPAETLDLGMSVYVVDDDELYSYPTLAPYEGAWDLWTGPRGTLTLGDVRVNAFYLFNYGKRESPGFEHAGHAGRIEGIVALGAATLKVQGIYTTGEDDPSDLDSDEFRTIAQGARDNFGSQGYWNYLVITSPHGPSDVADLGVGLQNRGLGLLTLQTRFDFPIAAGLDGFGAVGALWSDVDNPVSNARYMGTEVAGGIALDLGGGLIVETGAAGLFTGPFYESSGGLDPDDLFEVYLRTQLEF